MFLRMTTSSLALALIAAPVWSLTPDELWTSWTNSLGKSGYTVAEGARDQAGETLTLRDVTLTRSDEGASVIVTLPEVVMTGTGDGGVRSTFEKGATWKVDVRGADDAPVSASGSVQMPGTEVVSTGDAASHTDTARSPTLTLTLDRVDRAEGEPLNDVARMTMTDVTSETTYAEGGADLTYKAAVASTEFTVDAKDGDDTIKAAGKLGALESSGRMKTPGTARLDFGSDMGEALRAGASLDGTVKIGGYTTDFEIRGKDDDGAETTATGNAKAGTSDLAVRVDERGLGYQGAATDVAVSMTSSDLPMPLAYALGQVSFDVQVPVLKADAPQPFKLAYSVDGLTLDEGIWAMFDPGKKLPRDPASMDLDITAQALLTADLFDPEAMKALEDEAAPTPAADGADASPTPDAGTGGSVATPGEAADEGGAPLPFEVTQVTINQFALNAAGVNAEARGELTVPEGGSIAQPVGTITATVQGANKLLDTLGAMGLVPAENVTGYKMMLTMFAKPGEGEDTLVSEIKLTEGGGITVNGQEIPH